MRKPKQIGDAMTYRDYDKVKPIAWYSPRIGNYRLKVLQIERDNVICEIIEIYK